jgi:3-oxoacyl-[acyl-carrier protein] reductase
VTSRRDRVAVVTGAGQGIGKAIADRFVAAGHRVVFADLERERAEAAAAASGADGAHAVAVELDVRSLQSVEGCLAGTIDRWGPVHVWVNNAALTRSAPFLEIEPAQWDDVVTTNLRGTYFGCRVAGAHMIEHRFGRIINLASLAGQWGRSPTGAHYASSKAGIVAVTRYAAAEFASCGVTVNAIAPTAIEGPSVAAMPPESIQAYSRQIPVGRLGLPSEVAALAEFLASDESGFITGATYDINGGILMR